jgi:Spy/CpxP family protein refolding chaperone
MKKFILIAICAVLGLAVQAQTNIDELKYLQNMFGMEKKQLVAERMNISTADSAKFWALYEDYELYRSEISEKRANNVQQYVDNYKNITNAKANEILKNTFEINNEQSKLWQKTYNTMSKALSPVTAGQFIYLEMYIEALGRERLSNIIPHIGEKK